MMKFPQCFSAPQRTGKRFGHCLVRNTKELSTIIIKSYFDDIVFSNIDEQITVSELVSVFNEPSDLIPKCLTFSI